LKRSLDRSKLMAHAEKIELTFKRKTSETLQLSLGKNLVMLEILTAVPMKREGLWKLGRAWITL